MQREDQAVHLEQHLLRVGVGAQMAFGDGQADRAFERLLPGAHHGRQRIANRAGPVVELDRTTDVDAARIDFHRHPAHPPIEQRLQSRQAARFAHRGKENVFLELDVILADHRDLQLFARAEMREDARLAHVRDFGERADRQAFEAHVGSESERGVEDRRARLLALHQRALRAQGITMDGV